MPKPTTTVYFAFNLSQSITFDWQDVTSYVRSVSIDRGISRELESYSAGTAQVVLSNRTRAFDPTNTSSPFYGLIEPAGALKIVAGGVTIFQGFIDAWNFDFSDRGTDATATVSASDALSLLNKIEMLDTDVVAETTGNRILNVMTSDSVSWIYPLRLGAGTKELDAGLVAEGTNALSYLQQVALNEPGDLYVNRSGDVVFVDNAWYTSSSDTVTKFNYCGNPSFEVDTTFWSGVTRSAGAAYIGSYGGSIASGATAVYARNSFSAAAGKTYTVSFYYRYSGFPIIGNLSATFIYEDAGGVGRSTTSTFSASGNWRRVSLTKLNDFGSSAKFELRITAPSSNTVFIDAVMIEAGSIPSGYFDGASTTVAPAGHSYAFSWDGTAHASTSRFVDSPSEPTSYTTVTNFSDSSGTAIKVNDIGVSLNSENLYNDIRISGVSIGEAADSSRKATYGIRTFTFDGSLHSTDTEAQAVAEYWLTIFKDPEFRADRMTSNLNALSTASQGTVLALDLRSQVDLYFTPIGGGSAIDKLYSVIGISHEIDAEQHIMNFNLSSMENQPMRWSNALFGVWDESRWG